MMSEVKYGRRQGQTRSAPTHQQQPADGAHAAPGGGHVLLPFGKTLKDVTILPKDDWNRIHYNLNKEKIEAEKRRKEKAYKEKLFEESVKKHSQWKNTIGGEWQQKIEAREARIEKEEKERKEVDVEHERYVAQQRKEMIEKAKTKQYFQTDRVKNFHSALMLTEVLKERDAQLELKRLKEEAMRGMDNEWLEQNRIEHEEAILRAQKEAQLSINHRKEAAEFQKAQIRHHQKVERRTKDEELLEAHEIKKLAAQFELEKKRLGEIKEQESKQMMADNLRQIQDVQRMQEIKKLQEEEEDEECRIFAAAKKKMVKMRKEREKELLSDKLNVLDEIREKLGAQMKQKLDTEDDRIQNAVEQADAKRAKEEAAKSKKQQDMYKAIAQHRADQMRQQEIDARESKKAELAAMVARREADTIFAANEDEKSKRKLDEEKELATVLLKQADERHLKSKIAREMDVEAEKKNRELLLVEEDQFQEYAQKVISHAEKRGRNTYPLKQAAKEGAGGGVGPQFLGKGGLRPSYMVADLSGVQLPSFQSVQSKDVKSNMNGSAPTGKRLGFVW